VAEAAVIGIPSEQWGEVGMAIVAVKPGHSLAAAEIQAHCAANLARYKCPRLIEFVVALPRNATGKIHKPTLRKNFGSPDVIDKPRTAVSQTPPPPVSNIHRRFPSNEGFSP
jgi:fatty-acyl-CoA synthase